MKLTIAERNNLVSSMYQRGADEKAIAKAIRLAESEPTYIDEDTLLQRIEEDLETGCWIWTGRFRPGHRGDPDAETTVEYPDLPGVHKLCGHSHFMAAHTIKENQLGRPLDRVKGVCSTNTNQTRHACVNPDHHVVAE
jgi:hypothetical protein